MENIYIRDIVDILTKYHEILKIIKCKNLNSQLKYIDKIISYISLYSDVSLEDLRKKFEIEEVNEKKHNKNKQSFKEVIELIDKKEFDNIKGIKLKYNKFNNKSEIITFIESKSKDEVLKLANLRDLNLIYYLISENTVYRKIKKEDLYNEIISYLKAMKQGEAFKNYSHK